LLESGKVEIKLADGWKGTDSFLARVRQPISSCVLLLPPFR
jgi:hypothetical protein